MKGAYTDAPFIIYAIKETSENLFNSFFYNF